MLELRDVTVTYGAVQALKNISLQVPEGEIVTIIGPNGAGKSTCLKAVSGLVPFSGEIFYKGAPLSKRAVEERVKLGVVHLLEGRRFFGDQTVHDNLILGAFARARSGKEERRRVNEDIESIYTRFPILAERKKQLSATLSGGQQQILLIAMALMARPRLLLLDEPSLGLAPKMVQEVFALISELKGSGITILLVEQIATQALKVAGYGYVFSRGQVSAQGLSSELSRMNETAELGEIYLGGGNGNS